MNAGLGLIPPMPMKGCFTTSLLETRRCLQAGTLWSIHGSLPIKYPMDGSGGKFHITSLEPGARKKLISWLKKTAESGTSLKSLTTRNCWKNETNENL